MKCVVFVCFNILIWSLLNIIPGINNFHNPGKLRKFPYVPNNMFTQSKPLINNPRHRAITRDAKLWQILNGKSNSFLSPFKVLLGGWWCFLLGSRARGTGRKGWPKYSNQPPPSTLSIHYSLDCRRTEGGFRTQKQTIFLRY